MAAQNAAEGRVRETHGARITRWQSLHAEDVDELVQAAGLPSATNARVLLDVMTQELALIQPESLKRGPVTIVAALEEHPSDAECLKASQAGLQLPAMSEPDERWHRAC